MLKIALHLTGDLHDPKNRNLAEHALKALGDALKDLGAEVQDPREHATLTRPAYPKKRGEKIAFDEIPQFGDEFILHAELKPAAK
jgi:hypothetical protein